MTDEQLADLARRVELLERLVLPLVDEQQKPGQTLADKHAEFVARVRRIRAEKGVAL